MSNAPAFLSMCALHVLETSTSLLFHPRFVLSFPPSDIARAVLSESCRCGCAVFFDAESKAKFVEILRGMMMKKTKEIMAASKSGKSLAALMDDSSVSAPLSVSTQYARFVFTSHAWFTRFHDDLRC